MLSLSTVENVTSAWKHRALPPRAEITRRGSEELGRTADDFGDLRAEVFSCRSHETNQLEVVANTHAALLRCEGTSSRCEIVWPGNNRREKLGEFQPGSIVFSPASNPVRVTKKDVGNYRYISAYIPPSALTQLNDDSLDATDLTLPPQAGTAHAGLSHVMLSMKQEIDDPGPAGTLYKETLGLQLLIQLVRCTCSLILPSAKGGLSGWRLRRVTELLEADLTQTPSIKRLATEVGLSPAHFCTAFKQSTGHSPHRYLLLRKVAQAKQLMADARLSLTEIALSSGFGSSSQFATTFRRIIGRTPSDYRRGL